GGQDITFLYRYLAPGATPAETVTVCLSRGAAPETWQVDTPGYTGLLSITGSAAKGVHVRQLDGAAPGDLPATVHSPAAGRLVVTQGATVFALLRVPPLDTDTLDLALHGGEDTCEAPMPGKIIQVLVGEGDAVVEGARLVVMEAMKMEFTIKAPHDGQVARLPVRVGQLVQAGTVLAEVKA
ncbi:MAG TPA: biotin/lipoyl-containing protein, partial [Chloroflexia bacterium]|nr:biotin/lipoyl-containing protein [Chloroflexia bacterium]